MKLFGGLFAPGDPLIALARSGDFRTFAESFVSSEVFVIARRELTGEATRAARSQGVTAFTYGPEGEEVLPVFSTQAAAEAFAKAYVELANRVVPFITSSLEGAMLIPMLAGKRLGVVINPLTDEEYELPRELVAELRSLRY